MYYVVFRHMPFTFAHPAIILPLNRLPKKAISLIGLVIGSMTPDFEYFLRMRIYSIYRHTIPGIFYFDLPVGLISFFLYYCVIKDVIIDHLPQALMSRLIIFKGRPAIGLLLRRCPVIIISIIIGAASHLFWDGFTHPHGYFVNRITFLSATVNVADHFIYAYKVLQHLSTLIGFAVIAYALKQMHNHSVFECRKIFLFWGWVLLIAMSTLTIRILGGLPFTDYGNLIATGIAGFLVGLSAVSTYIIVVSKH